MVIKGILDPEDAEGTVRFGADGLIVSNQGGRQLDGVLFHVGVEPLPGGAGARRMARGRKESLSSTALAPAT